MDNSPAISAPDLPCQISWISTFALTRAVVGRSLPGDALSICSKIEASAKPRLKAEPFAVAMLLATLRSVQRGREALQKVLAKTSVHHPAAGPQG
jgi:hypothetical protein